MRNWLVFALLALILPAAAARADTEGGEPCGTKPELPALLEELHSRNAVNIDAANVQRLQMGGLGDRIDNNLLVIEDAGDLVVNGVTDTTEIVNRAIRLAGDRFDFITVLAAAAFPGNVSPEIGFAFFNLVNSSVRGVGLPLAGDPNLTVLKGYINLNDLDEYPSGPAATLPGFNGVMSGIEVLGHEAGHWAEAYIQAPAAQILGRDASHWSFYLNSHGSVMEGNLWIDNGNGTFTTAPPPQQYDGYSQLDLYLWGLMSASEATEPIFVITNPGNNPGQGRFSLPQGGFTTSGTRTQIGMADIVGLNGPRDPAYPIAPNRFTMAFVLVVPFGQQVSSADMGLATQFRTQWEAWFADRTGGRGSFDTSVPAIPVAGEFLAEPRAGGPAPFVVQFSSHLEGTVTGVHWDFGDGGVSTEPNPAHVYASNGVFDVTLTVDGAGGPMASTRPGYVTVGNFTSVRLDDFETEEGWSVDPLDTATGGRWERADPVGTWAGASPVQPENDHTPAPGAQCYVTGAAAGASPGANDVDGGATTLGSPMFSLTGVENAYLGYWYWFLNDLPGNPGDDSFRVELSNDAGATWIPAHIVTSSAARWRLHQIRIADFLAPTGSMQVRFAVSDTGASSLVEAALDDVAFIGLPPMDADVDGVRNGLDNCPFDFNPAQDDSDTDGTGDDCDCAPLDPGISRIPGEVGPTLRFIDATSAEWQATPQAVSYNVYRGMLGSPPHAWSSVCYQPALSAGTFTDPSAPPPGAAFHYLVTGRNCFGEGTAGAGSDGSPRPFSSRCP